MLPKKVTAFNKYSDKHSAVYIFDVEEIPNRNLNLWRHITILAPDNSRGFDSLNPPTSEKAQTTKT